MPLSACTASSQQAMLTAGSTHVLPLSGPAYLPSLCWDLTKAYTVSLGRGKELGGDLPVSQIRLGPKIQRAL